MPLVTRHPTRTPRSFDQYDELQLDFFYRFMPTPFSVRLCVVCSTGGSSTGAWEGANAETEGRVQCSREGRVSEDGPPTAQVFAVTKHGSRGSTAAADVQAEDIVCEPR